MKEYRKRIADDLLARKLRGLGAVLVQGPKWCGKTTTCEQQSASVLHMDDPDTKESNIRLADINIKELLTGERPRLIDEWQLAPKFWDAVRYQVDHEGGSGLFVLTGSAVPPDTSLMSHSGIGRISRLTMRTMTLWESGESSGGLSLGELFGDNGFLSCKAHNIGLRDMAAIICRGGWPAAVMHEDPEALDLAAEYYNAVCESDISRVDGVEREPSRVRRLMRSYARLQGTQANLSVIRRDLMVNAGRQLSEDTIASYLGALRKIFVVEDLEAWSPNLRSKVQIRTSDTRYFTDPSIATAALGVGPGNLMEDLTTFGFFFEALAIRDLRVYAEALSGSVGHYLDASGLECDAVVHLQNGDYALVEIKLGGDALVAKGVASLNALEGKLDVKTMKRPAFKMVLTAVGEYAYRRKEDGIIVCPITALRP